MYNAATSLPDGFEHECHEWTNSTNCTEVCRKSICEIGTFVLFVMRMQVSGEECPVLNAATSNDKESFSMDEEIELRQYLRVLTRHWILILAITAVCTLVALGLTLSQPALYRASVTLLAQPTKYEWRMDPNIQHIVDTRKDWKREYLALFESFDLSSEVAEAIGDSLPPAERSEVSIRESVSARSGVEDIFYIDAQSSDAAAAAGLANGWAEAFAQRVGELYGPAAELSKFETQLAEAEATLGVADEELEAFRRSSGLGLEQSTNLVLERYFSALEKRLEGKNTLLAEYQNALDALRLVIRQAEKNQGGDGAITDLPLELLEVASVQARGQATAERVLAQSDWAEVLSILRREEQLLADTVSSLQEEVETLQEEMAALDREHALLQQQYSLAREVHSVLSREVTESRIQAGVDAGGAQILSPASPPTGRAGSRQVMDVLVAAALGLVVSVLAAFAVEFVQRCWSRAQAPSD